MRFSLPVVLSFLALSQQAIAGPISSNAVARAAEPPLGPSHSYAKEGKRNAEAEPPLGPSHSYAHEGKRAAEAEPPLGPSHSYAKEGKREAEPPLGPSHSYAKGQ